MFHPDGPHAANKAYNMLVFLKLINTINKQTNKLYPKCIFVLAYSFL